MAPCVLPDEYVFCTVPDGDYSDYSEYCPLASFLESEGLTLVLTRTNAKEMALMFKETKTLVKPVIFMSGMMAGNDKFERLV